MPYKAYTGWLLCTCHRLQHGLRLWSEQQNGLQHRPIKHCWHMVIWYLPSQYLYQLAPNISRAPEVLDNFRSVVAGLVQGSYQILELCYPFHHLISLSTIYTKSIYLDLWSNSTYLRINPISVNQFYQAVWLCFSSLSHGILITKLVHHDIGVGKSWIISTLDFQCLYMKCSRSLPGLCALARHPLTRNASDVRMRENYTTYVSLKSSDIHVNIYIYILLLFTSNLIQASSAMIIIDGS